MGRISNAWKALVAGPNEFKVGPTTSIGSFGSSVTPMQRLDQQADDGYLKNVVIYKCVNLISHNAARVPFKLFSGPDANAQEIQKHPLLDLLRRPTPTSSGVELFTAHYGYHLLTGNSYLYGAGPENQPFKELWPIRPDRVEIKPGPNSIPKQYDHIVDGTRVGIFDVDQNTGESILKHTKLWHPTNDWYGASPLLAAAIATDRHNAASMHNLSMINNGGSPSGAMIYKPEDSKGNPIQLTPEQRQSILNDMRARMEGHRNAGRMLLLEGNFEWKSFGMSMKEMEWTDGINMSAKEIALAYDVPSQMIGIEGSLTFANYEQARLALWEEGIIPRMEVVLADLNEWLVPRFGDGLDLRYDFDAVTALAERKNQVMDQTTKAVEAGIMTLNEARDRNGLGPVPGGDVIMVSATMVPLSDIGGEADQPEDDDDDDDKGTIVDIAQRAYGGD
jgi:HK97 family phage portal protein